MTIVLRDYQIEAVDALWTYFERATGNPLVLMPTASGKALVIAGFCKRASLTYPGTRILVLTHVKELIEQNHSKLVTLWPQASAGIYSAGLNRRDYREDVIFAGIASVYDKPEMFGRIDIVLIDEAHLVSPDDETMYRSFFDALRALNPLVKFAGFSATGYRLGLGELQAGGLFTDVCFDYTTMEKFNRLVDEGWLSRLDSLPTGYKLDVDKVRTRGGEYVEKELQEAVDRPEVTRRALDEVMRLCGDRKRWLVFACGVHHCEEVADALEERGVSCVTIHNKLKRHERDERYQAFKRGEVTCAINNNILTTGVDVPEIDLIIVLRPTKSTALWVQMLGRGSRVVYAPGYDTFTREGRLAAIAAGPKQSCLVLDFARNTARLGPINDPVLPRKPGEKLGGEPPIKTCEVCEHYCHPSVRVCPYCGTPFPLRVRFEEQASELAVMKWEPPHVELIEIKNVVYHVQPKKGRPPSLRVSYFTPNMLQRFQEFICFEHEGPARNRAIRWWQERAPDIPVPRTVVEARDLASCLRIPKRLRVWVNKKPQEIVGHEYD